MKIGTYYYPEQWPREDWDRDLDAIAAAGFGIVHFAEFAWFSLEPSPGDFRFDWLEEVVEMSATRGLDVILCTPTAAPPVWLSRQPGVLPVTRRGHANRHGGRRHYTPTSPAMRDATRRVVDALARRFGDHPAVIGWQIDNEYSGDFDQQPHTDAAFAGWLRRKYGDVKAWNAAWGNQFWNTYYTSFEQVRMPVNRDPDYANPHHHLDASRFWSHAYADFNKLQHDRLRPHIGDRWVSTNFMPFHLDCDPGDMRESLSLWSWDSYPLTGWGKNEPNEDYRTADPGGIEFVHDQMRSYNGRWALMEVQPGQVNWSGYPCLPYPGAVRLWLWTAIAHGCSFITVYRWRQPPFGIEQFHAGLLGHDGVTPTSGGREFFRTIREMRTLAEAGAADDTSYEPVGVPDEAHTVGLLFDFDQLWGYATLPQAERWSQPKLLSQWHAAVSRLGLDVRILHPGEPIPPSLKLLIVPGLQMADGATTDAIRAYAHAGGHVVLTCRTATMDKTGAHWPTGRAAPILDLVGGTIDAYDGLPKETSGEIDCAGERHRWGVWGDLMTPRDGTDVLARYADQFYAGTAAVLRNRVGAGVVTTCGVFDEGSLTRQLAEDAARLAGYAVTPLPPRVRQVRRGDLTIVLNYTARPYECDAPDSATFLVGGRTVDPAGVAVWRG